MEQPAVEPKPVESAEMKPHFKRVYLRQTDFDNFGYSAQCRACTLLRLGMDRQGILHTEECRLRMVQRLQETEYGRKRIQIAEKRECEAKEETEKEKKLKVTLEPEVQPQDNPGGPASSSGIKRPAQDPPEDPRLEPDISETQLDTPMETSAESAQPSRGTKRDADAAGVSVEPMDDETAITNLLLSHRRGFLGALHARLYQSVRSSLTLTLKDLGIMVTFLESPWTPRWSKQRDVKNAKLFRQWVFGNQFPGQRMRR